MTAFAVAGLAVFAGAGSAAAAGDPSGDALRTTNGGVPSPGSPQIEDVVCLTRCVANHKATPGATVKVEGSFLDGVTRVVFRGQKGPIRSRQTYRSRGQVRTIVPRRAVSGRPYVVDSYGSVSNRSPKKLRVLPRSAIPTQVFPVRGPHQYWDGFGAGRGHEGADVGAACGTRLVSALSGVVQRNTYHSAAGNYVVIDSKGSPDDLAYMHLIRPSIVSPGQHVSAGQTIGYVGETGRASGCHLHFEYWSGDYYGGGHPVDPVPFLKALDKKS